MDQGLTDKVLAGQLSTRNSATSKQFTIDKYFPSNQSSRKNNKTNLKQQNSGSMENQISVTLQNTHRRNQTLRNKVEGMHEGLAKINYMNSYLNNATNNQDHQQDENNLEQDTNYKKLLKKVQVYKIENKKKYKELHSSIQQIRNNKLVNFQSILSNYSQLKSLQQNKSLDILKLGGVQTLNQQLMSTAHVVDQVTIGNSKIFNNFVKGKFTSKDKPQSERFKMESKLRFDQELEETCKKTIKYNFALDTLKAKDKTPIEQKNNIQKKKYFNKWYIPVKYWNIQKKQYSKQQTFVSDPLYLYKDFDHIESIYNDNPFVDDNIPLIKEKKMIENHDRDLLKISNKIFQVQPINTKYKIQTSKKAQNVPVFLKQVLHKNQQIEYQ